MDSDSGYFRLGLFVIVGIALLVGGVVLFGAGALFTDNVSAETAFLGSVDGLDVGAAVKWQGITIGKVSRIGAAMWDYTNPDPAKMAELRRYVVVEFQVRRDMLAARSTQEMVQNLKDRVDRGLRARMASSGLTGPAFVELTFVDPTQYPVAELPWKPPGLFVPGVPSEITEIVASVREVMGQVKEAQVATTVADLRQLIRNTDTKITELDVKDLQAKVVSLVDEVRASNRRVKEILDNPKISQTIDDLPAITSKTRDTMARVDEIVHDPKVQQTLDDLQATANAAAPLAVELRRLLRRLDQIVASEGQNLEAIISSLRRVLEQGAALVEDARNNPSRLLFGEPPPRIRGDQR